ncbi:UNKNOWN [Stylonychia lemnae]|uniref:Uncharacterized protein n=1 Tax=Stylonychia lemnae TaxID=5949 RepID=A0A078A5A9_STYLE|nr:UNKNOWN [Stylonychia lemnae]|eukprot:CDW75939.1 UNKNOWN [Stylonychia lemnae]
MYQSPDKTTKNPNFQEYQSPYSVRQLKKQEMELVMSQPKPAKDKQTMKQFLKLISHNNEGPSSPTSLNKSAYSQNSARKQRVHGPLSVSQIISSRIKSPRASEKQSEYQQLLETERPKRSELSIDSIDEEKDKQKLDHLKHKLQSEKGFTQDDIQTIDQNMIFFKCVADIKKRQQEQRSKMNPDRIKNVQSKISQANQNRLSSNQGSRQKKNLKTLSNQRPGPQIILDGDFEMNNSPHQARVNSNQFSDINSDEELMREEMKDIGIEDIIQHEQDNEVDQEEVDDLLRDTLTVAEFDNSREQSELNKLKDTIESQHNNQNNLQLQDSGQNPQKRRTPSVGNLLMSSSLQNVVGNFDEQFNVQYIDDGQDALGSSGLKKNSSQRRLSQNNSNSNNNSKIMPQQRDRQIRNRLSIGQNIGNEQSLSYNKTIISNISPMGRGSISPERPHYQEATESFLKMMSPKIEKSQSGSNNQSFSKPQKNQVKQTGYLQSKADWISKLQPIKNQQQK